MPFSENSQSPVVAIVGATGAVGREMLAVLEQRKFPCRDVRLLASSRSAGTAWISRCFPQGLPSAGNSARWREIEACW